MTLSWEVMILSANHWAGASELGHTHKHQKHLKLKVSNLTSSLKSENPFSFALDYASFKLRKIRMTNSQRYREGGEISYTRRRIYMLSKCCIRGVFKTDFWRYLGFCPNQGASYSGGERRCYRYGTTTTTNERTVNSEQ